MLSKIEHLSVYSENRHQIITPIDLASRYPEVLDISMSRYHSDIDVFRQLANSSSDSGDLLLQIRTRFPDAKQKMTLLKIFRRCVCPVVDTEMARKARVPTSILVQNYSEYFKPIELVCSQFNNFTPVEEAALAALVGEYDTRGQSGYILTSMFFDWFDDYHRDQFFISGPRGAGRDIELKTLFDTYDGNFPCDFVIKDRLGMLCAIGFARYDATRGGAQSDDRTGGNADKVSKAREFCIKYGHRFRIVFLSDGPGLAHLDTWQEACKLDGAWDGAVRVTTLKTAHARVTAGWLKGTDIPTSIPSVGF
ncbi:hypothetical protein YA0637_21080 [Pseudomonas syringae]|uniref:hypothetical protein n=1 Tax=Pseudomonas syringae TaxID=317 RepID=UPI0018E5EF3C|nr:hypothetical protein [Pseudomonas syringae]MBI6674037.1 hypothetical protein [Pseudomonas syringae]